MIFMVKEDLTTVFIIISIFALVISLIALLPQDYNGLVNLPDLTQYENEDFIDLEHGLCLWLTFDNSPLDKSGYRLDGTLTNTTYQTGRFYKDISCDGNDWVEGTNNQLLDFVVNNFTITLWYKPYSISVGTGYMLYTRGKYNLDGMQFYTSGSSLLFTTSQAAATQISSSSGGLNNGTWNFLTIKRVGSSIRILNNLTDITNIAGNHINPLTSVRTWKIGVYDNKGDMWLNGEIDDVRIYNRLLTNYEIQKLYTLN